MNSNLLEKYSQFLPVSETTPMISMGEGGTPLVQSKWFSKLLGCPNLYFKLENCNPTGSFKDRGMVMAVVKALESGSRGLICASTGNTSASASAYGAYSQIPVTVVIPEKSIAMGKLVQARAHGAKILAVNGNFDEALCLVREISNKGSLTLVNSVNPYRLEGQKTAAFEIIEELGEAPDMLFLPVGNAGNITAYWNGFKQYQRLGRSTITPKMMGFQSAGAAPIVKGYPIKDPKTVASAIKIGRPANWEGAIIARDESGGSIEAVSDEAIMNAYRGMAFHEGIFCEPSSAAAVAGVMEMKDNGWDLRDQRIVCVITGSGLKDIDAVSRDLTDNVIRVPARLKDIEAEL